MSAQDLFCPPYYRWVYEDLLAEEVSYHLKKELRKIAKQRARKLCEEHLVTIRNHELTEQTTNLAVSNVTNPSNSKVNAQENPNGNDNENPDGNVNCNNEKDRIFATWQKISYSYFYLMDEGFVQEKSYEETDPNEHQL